MKTGDYVRTKDGFIARLIEKDIWYKFDGVILEEEYTYNYLSKEHAKELIIKSSPNIIDLIEVGDYVNGREVREVYDLGFGKCFCFKNEYGRHYDKTYKIKSIVTKEQFESMEYKVVK